jgi:hypothetical protein
MNNNISNEKIIDLLGTLITKITENKANYLLLDYVQKMKFNKKDDSMLVNNLISTVKQILGLFILNFDLVCKMSNNKYVKNNKNNNNLKLYDLSHRIICSRSNEDFIKMKTDVSEILKELISMQIPEEKRKKY